MGEPRFLSDCCVYDMGVAVTLTLTHTQEGGLLYIWIDHCPQSDQICDGNMAVTIDPSLINVLVYCSLLRDMHVCHLYIII